MKIHYNTIDETFFVRDFLEQFFQKEFGIQPKVEVGAFVIYCLVKNDALGDNPKYFNIASDLVISAMLVGNVIDKLQRRAKINKKTVESLMNDG